MANETPSKKLRLGFLISGGGRTMLNLVRLSRAGSLNIEPAVVVASRLCKGIELARAEGLDTHLVPYKEMPSLEEYSRQITALLDAAKVDLIIMAGLLSPYLIPTHYLGKVINIHPALLPAFGGRGMYGHHVHEAVLRYGCKISGCTVHFVTNEYDRGPIILQKAVPVLEDDTPDSLAARVFEQELLALPEAVALYSQGRLRIDGQVVHVR
jgi:phosphoribosylglycinamide formyltransferase 1